MSIKSFNETNRQIIIKKPLSFFFLIFTLCAGILNAQEAKNPEYFVLSGTITEKGSGETLPGVQVSCDSIGITVATNQYGFFSLRLPVGWQRVSFKFVGFQRVDSLINLQKNSTINIGLNAGVQLKEVEIEGELQRRVSDESRMSTISIPISQIKDIPALLGEKDVLKVIQLLPGVQKGGEGNSGLYVRGGGPDQNLIILDDAPVYNAFHLFGFFSLFNGDALKSVELVKGGFPARYGGRLSSVLEMQMKEGNREKLHGEAGIGLVSSKMVLEGPIAKNKASFLVSARRTYIDAFVYPLLPKEGKGGYYFYDLNTKVNWSPTDKDRLYLSGYFGNDKFYFNSQSGEFETSGDLLWGNATGTLRWNHIYNGKWFSNASLIFSDYKLGINASEKFDTSFFSLGFNSGIRDWSAKFDFDYFPSPNHHVRLGVITCYHTFTPSAVVLKDNNFGLNLKVRKVFTTETGIYAEDDFKIGHRLRFNSGIRLSHYATKGISIFNPEPRISGRLLLGPKTSFKTGYALMNQYLHLLSSTGLSLPTDLWVPATARLKPMRSQQIAAGIAHDLKEGLQLTVEGYYKTMNNVSFYKEGASFLLIGNNIDGNGISWEDNVTQGKGWSYGAEFLIQKTTGKFTGWIGYTLSWTWVQFDSVNFGKRFFPRYDRRHDISMVGIYKLNENITFSATWIYGTGNAITLPLGRYNAAPHDPAATSGFQTQSLFGYNTAFRNDYGEKNSFRMAPYHRLDVGLQFLKKKKWGERIFEISVYNAYNRYNPFFYFIEQTGPSPDDQKLMQVTLFPFIPSVSWTWKF